LEQVFEILFQNISLEFNLGIAGAPLLHRVGIAGGVGMISSRDNKSCFRYFGGKQLKRLNHQFKPFVGAPLAESENSRRISAHREIRKFWSPGQNAVGPQMHVIAPVLVIQNLPISRHQDGDRI
jgi:hypothetical protein